MVHKCDCSNRIFHLQSVDDDYSRYVTIAMIQIANIKLQQLLLNNIQTNTLLFSEGMLVGISIPIIDTEGQRRLEAIKMPLKYFHCTCNALWRCCMAR